MALIVSLDEKKYIHSVSINRKASVFLQLLKQHYSRIADLVVMCEVADNYLFSDYL